MMMTMWSMGDPGIGETVSAGTGGEGANREATPHPEIVAREEAPAIKTAESHHRRMEPAGANGSRRSLRRAYGTLLNPWHEDMPSIPTKQVI